MVLVHYGDRSAHFDPATLAFASESESFAVECDLKQQEYSKLISVDQKSYTREDYLERLVVNVANYCNLDCVYCYAQGGDYGGPIERLAESIGRSAVSRFLERYKKIGLLQFFGGEPLLNVRLIDHLCSFCTQEAHRLGRPVPRFGIVTNGTLLNDRAIDIIVAHQIEVTVSLDGPPIVTDVLRFQGSKFKTVDVIHNIRKLATYVDQPAQIEGTYTALHCKLGIEVNDVVDFVRDELGVGVLHLANNVLPSLNGDPSTQYLGEREHLDGVSTSYADAVVSSFKNLLTVPVNRVTVIQVALDILDILSRPPRQDLGHVCPAGTGTIAVDSDGKIYPCFMFYRKSSFEMGNVRSAESDLVDETKRVAFADRNLLVSSKFVKSSWANAFFHGCAGGNFLSSGDHGLIMDAEVRFFEKIVSAAIVELARLKSVGETDFLFMAANLFRQYRAAPS